LDRSHAFAANSSVFKQALRACLKTRAALTLVGVAPDESNPYPDKRLVAAYLHQFTMEHTTHQSF